MNKLLTQVDSDYEPELMAFIKEKQISTASKLIEQLSPDVDEESNLNVCTIILDLFDNKEFYPVIFNKENLTKIVTYATAPVEGGSRSSKASSL